VDTITRTFPLALTSASPATVIELCHFRDMTFDADERVGIYLEAWMCNLSLKSFNLGVIPDFDGSESEIEKMAKFNAAEAKSQKIGLRILGRKNNIGDWQEKAEIILVNRGRKDYFDLMQPYLAKNAVRILEKNDALGVQLVDYGNGWIQNNDSVSIELGVTITIAKKNNMDIFNARFAALELILENRLINVPANTLLGRDSSTGTIQAIPQSRYATPQQIDQAIIDLVGGAPGALNTLIELAAALNNDANFASTITNQLALKAPLTAPRFSNGVNITGNLLVENGMISTTPNLGPTNSGSPGFQAGTDVAGNVTVSLFGGSNKKVCYFDFSVNLSDYDCRFLATTTELSVQTAADYYFSLGTRLKASLPTSPAGLPPGALWRNQNVVSIV
jgi:hypothetical protein